jgi:hypothetical protein
MIRFREAQPKLFWVTEIPEVEFVALLDDIVVAATSHVIYLLDRYSGALKHKFDEASHGLHLYFKPPVGVAGFGDEIRVCSEWNSDVFVSIDGTNIRTVPDEFDSLNPQAINTWTYLTERTPCLSFSREVTDDRTPDGAAISYVVATDMEGREVWLSSSKTIHFIRTVHG